MKNNQERVGKWLCASLLLGTAALSFGCDDDEGDVMETGDAGRGTPGGLIDAGTGTGGDGGAAPTGNCPALGARPDEVVAAEITSSTTWTCQKRYVLDKSTFVKNGATLTIQPGTVIVGESQGALFITRDGKIDASGSKDAPIVFTSNEDEANRKRGDWKGVVLLGNASINATGGSTVFEGLQDIPDYRYGALNGAPNDAHDCGTIRYTRIEYAGFQIATDRELNGLTLAGCGADTELDYIQIHGGNDDGIEFFGGTANVKHLVLTGNDDDNIDWDLGWRGKAQFVIVQQHKPSSSTNAENGIEADNNDPGHANTPVSQPTLYNLTLIGANEGSKSRGMLLRRGTKGLIGNAIVQGFPLAAIDVRDSATVAGANDGTLNVTHSLFFQNGPGGSTPFPADTDNDGFDENAFFTESARANRVNVDPQLAKPYDTAAPSFVPAAGGAATTGAAAPPAGDTFFEATTYVGAVGPGADWTVGWTAYPPVR